MRFRRNLVLVSSRAWIRRDFEKKSLWTFQFHPSMSIREMLLISTIQESVSVNLSTIVVPLNKHLGTNISSTLEPNQMRIKKPGKNQITRVEANQD
jgi:hypothetical protein